MGRASRAQQALPCPMAEHSEDPPTEPVSKPGDEPATLKAPSQPHEPGEAERDDTKISSAYALGNVIGRGGMGEVILAHDRRIGRDVAIKRLHGVVPSEDD